MGSCALNPKAPGGWALRRNDSQLFRRQRLCVARWPPRGAAAFILIDEHRVLLRASISPIKVDRSAAATMLSSDCDSRGLPMSRVAIHSAEQAALDQITP
jgi:hypothetical protein